MSANHSTSRSSKSARSQSIANTSNKKPLLVSQRDVIDTTVLLYHPACKRLREQLGINVNSYSRKVIPGNVTLNGNNNNIQKDKSMTEDKSLPYRSNQAPIEYFTDQSRPLSISQNYNSTKESHHGFHSRTSSGVNLSLRIGKENRYSSRNNNSRRDSFDQYNSVEISAIVAPKQDNSAKKKLKLALNQMQKIEETGHLTTPKFAPFKIKASLQERLELSEESPRIQSEIDNELDKYVDTKKLAILCQGYKKALYSHEQENSKKGILDEENPQNDLPKKKKLIQEIDELEKQINEEISSLDSVIQNDVIKTTKKDNKENREESFVDKPPVARRRGSSMTIFANIENKINEMNEKLIYSSRDKHKNQSGSVSSDRSLVSESS